MQIRVNSAGLTPELRAVLAWPWTTYLGEGSISTWIIAHWPLQVPVRLSTTRPNTNGAPMCLHV
ncbi:hypothetical protein RSAG8_10111, partial [Rhizoctonia solani AG-8 WAC10335]